METQVVVFIKLIYLLYNIKFTWINFAIFLHLGAGNVNAGNAGYGQNPGRRY